MASAGPPCLKGRNGDQDGAPVEDHGDCTSGQPMGSCSPGLDPDDSMEGVVGIAEFAIGSDSQELSGTMGNKGNTFDAVEAVVNSHGSPQAVSRENQGEALGRPKEPTQDDLDAQEADDINNGIIVISSRIGERQRQKRAREEREAAVRIRHILSLEDAITPAQKRMALLRARFQN